jgi:hypothetical protein
MADRFHVSKRRRLVRATDCAPFNSARPRCPSSPERLDGHSELFVSPGSRRRQNTRSGWRGRLGPRHPTSNDRAYRQSCRQQPRRQGRPAEARRLVKAIEARAPKFPNPDCADIAETPATDCHVPVTSLIYVAALQLLTADAAVRKARFRQLGGLALSLTGGLRSVYSRTTLSHSAEAERRWTQPIRDSGIETARA